MGRPRIYLTPEAKQSALKKNQATWDSRHPDARKKQRRRHKLKHKYGMSPGDEQALWDRQGGICPGCLQPLPTGNRSADVDHDHKTGQVRGLLCRFCNLTLGAAKDSVDTLKRLTEYLERHNGKATE